MNIDLNIELVLLIRAFAFLILIDFVSGVLAAAKQGKLKSRSCTNGIFKSIGEMLVLGSFIFLERLVPVIHGYLSMFITFFIVKELISFAENLNKLDVWVPKFIVKALSDGINKVDNGELPINNIKGSVK